MTLALVSRSAALAWVSGKIGTLELFEDFPAAGRPAALYIVRINSRGEFRRAWRIGQRLRLPVVWNGGHESTVKAGNYRGDVWNGTRFYASADSVCRPRREAFKGPAPKS